MFDTLFVNATIITMQSEDSILYNAYCGIEKGRISYLGETAPQDMGAKRTIDCKGDILMPGLINCHAHTAMTLLRGFSDDCTLNDWLFNHIFPAEARLDERAVRAGFGLGVAEMISTGTTSFIDMYFYQDKMAHIADKAGVRAMLSNGVVALSDSYDFEKDRATNELFNMMMDEELSERIRPQAAIHSERTSPPEVWKKELDLAKEHGLSIHVHLSEPKEDQDNCVKEYGVSPTRRFYDEGVFDVPCVAAHCVHITEEDMRLLAEKNVTAVHNPVSNLKLASGIADICKMRDMGINVALGTDGCSSNNTLDMFEDMKFAALLAKNLGGDPSAFTDYDALCLATVNGAKAMGMESSIGKIECGYEADIILLDTHKLHRIPMYDPKSSAVYCLGGGDVYLTMVAGEVLYENGSFKTLDIDEIIKEVRDYGAPLVAGNE